jgi:hypothetical protein
MFDPCPAHCKGPAPLGLLLSRLTLAEAVRVPGAYRRLLWLSAQAPADPLGCAERSSKERAENAEAELCVPPA